MSCSAVAQQHIQIPYLTATTLRRGSVITNENSARVFGFNVDSSSHFEATEGVAAVRIQLRTLGKLTSPYEVQCFFCAKDPRQARYIYDALKTTSGSQFDEISVAARDLFSGSKQTDITRIRQTVTTDNNSTGTALLTITREHIVDGSTLEGWIVRIISGGQVVRMDASLQELKSFAEQEAEALDVIAAKLPEQNNQ